MIKVGGITAKGGLMTTVLEECSMILAMINPARRTIVLADASKLATALSPISPPWEEFKSWSRMRRPKMSWPRALKEAQVEVIVAAEDGDI